jgi:hypothetical protein
VLRAPMIDIVAPHAGVIENTTYEMTSGAAIRRTGGPVRSQRRDYKAAAP